VAIDSELACFRTNERNEDSFIISGVRRLRDGLSGREWQEAAKSEVKRVIRRFYDHDFQIIVVHNVTGRGSGSIPSFSVRLASVEAARQIRSKFSSFFAGGNDSRPTELQSVGIRNVLTKETRVRISILKLLGQRYKDNNPGGTFQVIGFEPRPVLKLTPPSGVSDRRVKTYTFIDAIQKLPVCFTDQEYADLAKLVGSKFSGRLKSIFVVLDDDRIQTARSLSQRQKRARGSTPDPEAPPSQRRAEDP